MTLLEGEEATAPASAIACAVWSPFPPTGGEGVGAETKSRACTSKARQDGVIRLLKNH